MQSNEIICPKKIEMISEKEFAQSFKSCLSQIETGTVFRVTGNKSLANIYKNFVIPKAESKHYHDFRMNTPELYMKQLIQKAAFTFLPLPTESLVDSTLRLRHTVGGGGFVGPHLDFHENLPADALNFWISFSKLERDETIQFLPAPWILEGTPIGHFKSGVYLDNHGRIMPFESLIKSTVSSPILPGEYFVFKSGRTAHCSPFFVKENRITADQRILLSNQSSDLNFACLPEYYPLSWINRFDGSFSVNDILSEYWNSDQAEDLRQSIELALNQTTGGNPIRKMAENPQIAHKIVLEKKISAEEPGVDKILEKEYRHVAMRLSLLQTTPSGLSLERLCKNLIELMPEAPQKIYPVIARKVNLRVLSYVWSQATEKNGIIKAMLALFYFGLMWFLQTFPILPRRLQIVTLNKVSWPLWRCFHSSSIIKEDSQ